MDAYRVGMKWPGAVEVESSSGPAIKLVRDVAERFADVWEEDADLISRFFPVTNVVQRTFSQLQQRRQKPYSGKKWVGIKENPLKVSQLYTPLNSLINTIIRAFALEHDDQGNRRLCLNTSKAKVFPTPFPLVWPALLLAGSGKHFVNSFARRPLREYSLAISPVEVCVEKDEDDTDELEDARSRLTVYMRDLFANQFNRRFAFGLIISQKSLVICLFDRAGILTSPTLDYHKHPEQFCAIIAGLASLDPTSIGLDPSMYVDDEDYGYLRTIEAISRRRSKITEYKITRIIFCSSFLLGRGTMCFTGLDTLDEKTAYVVKDSWMDADLEGKESEASLLAHAYACGITAGIPIYRHFEEIIVRESNGKLRVDSISANRKLQNSGFAKNRIHTRVVMTPCGKPLFQFKSQVEFLAAYRDAIRTHRLLYQRAGILHRDIKPQNILIVEGDEGPAGLLIDFDHSIRVRDTSPYSNKQKIGTYMYMSWKVLEGRGTHTFFNDLESFYYVLAHALVGFKGPAKPMLKLPTLLQEWRGPSAATYKRGFFMISFREKIHSWWSPEFQGLIEHIHELFRELGREELLALFKNEMPPPIDADQLYDSILSYVEEALAAISASSEVAVQPSRESPDLDSLLEEELHTSKVPQPVLLAQTTAAADRTLRKKAKY